MNLYNTNYIRKYNLRDANIKKSPWITTPKRIDNRSTLREFNSKLDLECYQNFVKKGISQVNFDLNIVSQKWERMGEGNCYQKIEAIRSIAPEICKF